MHHILTSVVAMCCGHYVPTRVAAGGDLRDDNSRAFKIKIRMQHCSSTA